MSALVSVPPRLAEVIDALDMAEDRSARIQMLIDIARRFREVSPSVATRPWDEAHRVAGCESEAFVWVTARADGAIDLHFAVENPQGVTARALAVILSDAFSGRPAEEAGALDDEIVFEVFGRDLSIGKSLGLMGIVAMVRTLALRSLAPAAGAAR